MNDYGVVPLGKRARSTGLDAWVICVTATGGTLGGVGGR